MVLDMEFLVELADFLVFKWEAIIYDYGLKDSIPTNDVVKDELRNLYASNVGHRNSFNPLGKVFGHNNDEFMTIGGCRMYLTNEVETPLGKGSW